VNLNGGVLSTARALADGGSGASVVNLNGGTLQAAASTVLLGNPGNYALGTFNVRDGGAIVDTRGFSATIGSPQLHSTVVGDNATDGGLTKIGAGTLTLLGASTYNGGTTISAGTLLVNNTAGSGTGSGAVTVHGTATLGGTGILVGPVTVHSGGTLSPGASLGTLTISNDLTLAGNLFIELNKSVSPSNDLVVVSGILTNAGVGTVTVTNLGLPALAAGDRFQLFSQPLLNGQALAITPAPGGGLVWANNLASDGSIGVVAGTVPATNLAIVAAGPLSFKLSGAGGANQSYGIYASTNVAAPMSAWWLIGTTNANAGGLIQFLDTQATNTQRFYRFGQ
jgi:fibronectin-binding autotransporter adhesin